MLRAYKFTWFFPNIWISTYPVRPYFIHSSLIHGDPIKNRTKHKQNSKFKQLLLNPIPIYRRGSFEVPLLPFPDNLSNNPPYHAPPIPARSGITRGCKECALTKLNGPLLTTMASRKDIYSSLGLVEREKFWSSTLFHRKCPIKETTEPKLILVSFCSGEDSSYRDTSYFIHILREGYRSVFIGPPCKWIRHLLLT